MSQRKKLFILFCSFSAVAAVIVLLNHHAARLTDSLDSHMANHSAEKVIINLAVAANFKPTLEAILAAYTHVDSDDNTQFNLISGSTGALYSQIKQGAPFDLFFAADTERPITLINEQRANDAAIWIYAVGQLALVFPKSSPSSDTSPCPTTISHRTELLALIREIIAINTQGENRLSIANPTTAPYGAAAQQLLDSLPANHPIKAWQIIKGKNILHSQQLLLTKHVDLAILSSAMEHQTHMQSYHFCKLSRQLYPKIEQAMIKIKSTTHELSRQHTITALLKFMEGTEAKKILSKHNYLSTQYNRAR